MKTINVTFEDDEYEQLFTKKEESEAKNWHDYLLLASGVIKRKDLKK